MSLIKQKTAYSVMLLFLFAFDNAHSQTTYNLSSGSNPRIDGAGDSFILTWPSGNYNSFEIYSTSNNGWMPVPWPQQAYWSLSNGDYFFQVTGCYDDDYYCDFLSYVTIGVTNSSVSPPTAAYQIRRHTSASITQNEADTILQDATEVLVAADDTNDFRCSIRFQRAGGIVAFSNGDGSIDTNVEWNSLNSGINIVSEINYCGGLAPNIIGCAQLPGTRIAVERHTNEDILWAHEIGHNIGLNHVSFTNNFMLGTINPNNRRITESQCAFMMQNI